MARMMQRRRSFGIMSTRDSDRRGSGKGIEMLRAARVAPPQGAQEAIGRVAPGFGWFGLGVLAAGATAWAIFSRTGRTPSDGQEPDGQETDGREPDVVLD